MFFPGSRYEKQQTYTTTLPNGAQVTAVQMPLPRRAPILGAHPRTDAQRLDHIAAHFLSDATAFWKLCDANGAMSPDALGASDMVAIPVKGG
jgi:hypothetical protein